MKIKAYDYGPIGKRIKNARVAKGLKQAFIAQKLDVNTNHISDIERGVTGLSIPALLMLCDILETDASYILQGEYKQNGNPVEVMLNEISPDERLVAEELLQVYVNSCKKK